MDKADPKAVAAGLTKAQREAVLLIGEAGVVQASAINAHTATALYKRGIISRIIAGGYRFADLTEHGTGIRAILIGEKQK